MAFVEGIPTRTLRASASSRDIDSAAQFLLQPHADYSKEKLAKLVSSQATEAEREKEVVELADSINEFRRVAFNNASTPKATDPTTVSPEALQSFLSVVHYIQPVDVNADALEAPLIKMGIPKEMAPSAAGNMVKGIRETAGKSRQSIEAELKSRGLALITDEAELKKQLPQVVASMVPSAGRSIP